MSLQIKYNPAIHHRSSIHMPGYDYSSQGDYFITLCINERYCLLGEILDGNMILNDAGQMVEKWFLEIQKKYPSIKCGSYVVMPNHFHFIIKIIADKQSNENISIFKVMNWFKTMTTNEYIRGVKNKNWQHFNKRFWQLRYWDHIIREENELYNIEQYIIKNPSKWEEDKLNSSYSNRTMEEIAIYEKENWMV